MTRCHSLLIRNYLFLSISIPSIYAFYFIMFIVWFFRYPGSQGWSTPWFIDMLLGLCYLCLLIFVGAGSKELSTCSIHLPGRLWYDWGSVLYRLVLSDARNLLISLTYQLGSCFSIGPAGSRRGCWYIALGLWTGMRVGILPIGRICLYLRMLLLIVNCAWLLLLMSIICYFPCGLYRGCRLRWYKNTICQLHRE